MLLDDIYSFLALTMQYPHADYCDADFFDILETMLTELSLQEDLTACRTWRNNSSDLLEDLQVEYTRLFINSATQQIIPPYASVFMDGDGTLQGKTTEKTHDFYRHCGYEVMDSTEPPDHLQHELNFLAALSREGRDEEAELFLSELFRPWFHQFRDRCMIEARHPVYKASIQLIDFFTKEEQ